MGKRKQSTPGRSVHRNSFPDETVDVQPPKRHKPAPVKQLKWEFVTCPELDARDVEIAEVQMRAGEEEDEEGETGERTAGVRLKYLNSSNRNLGPLLVSQLFVEVADGTGSVISGSLDCSEDVNSSLIHLVKRDYVGFRYRDGRLRVFITHTLFLACEDDPGHFYRSHIQAVILWLRPELSLQAIYDTSLKAGTGTSSVFDASRFYEAMRRSRDEPCMIMACEELLPKLTRYQQQAVHWMVHRENGLGDTAGEEHPLWVEADDVDGQTPFYYNIFSGSVSREPRDFCSYVRGGILADEMGLGKTVEVLACILANRYKGPVQLEPILKRLEAESNQRKWERVDCVCDTSESGVMVQCDFCDVWQHASCVGYKQSAKKRKKRVEENDDEFVCTSCAEVIASVEVDGPCGATLVVCPAPILKQWQEEITRHTRKLNVLVYEGVHKGCAKLGSNHLKRVGAHDLAVADIVLTTYDVLRADLFHDVDDGNQRAMRFEKRYQVIATPLTKLRWWRICLDEGQVVESNGAPATEMAMRLHAEFRWCISGTPIQRGLDDLYGLLRFLGAEPFDKHTWWMQAMRQPYEEGKQRAIDFTHSFFRSFMWRTTKDEVLDQLNIPSQDEQVTWLKFSCVESHFYRQQHEHCAKKAREVIDKCSTKDQPLNHLDASKLMKPLLRLRQACCHPQVGGFGIRSLQEKPMTMDEILEVLIEKAKTEGEEAQRSMLSALNGLAALKIIENDVVMATSIYREVLTVIEENANSFRVDPLQKLHTLYNLADVLKDVENSSVPRTLRDDLLHGQCEEIRVKYMSVRRTHLLEKQREFYDSNKKIRDAQAENKSLCWSNWWLDAFKTIERSKSEVREFLDKVRNSLEEVAGNASSLVLRFNDVNGLKLLLQQELDAMHEMREVLFDSLLTLDEKMDDPDSDDIKRAGQCFLCKQGTSKRTTCCHCDMEIMFQAYANRLFFLRTQATEKGGIVTPEEALLAQQRALARAKNPTKGASGSTGSRIKGFSTAAAAQVANRASEAEQILAMLLSYVKKFYEVDDIEAAKKHFDYLEALRLEFAAARSLATAQRTVLSALDEINMHITRFTMSDDKKNPFAVQEDEITEKNATLTSDKFIACDSLNRAKGQLRYLKGLAQARGTATGASEDTLSEEPCPICHEKLEARAIVFPCGHLLCCKCTGLVVSQTHAPPGGAHLKRVPCPTCRQRAYVSDCALANAEASSPLRTDLREEDEPNEESLIEVKGSYGTKIEAVLRRILKIQSTDCFAKILVFSSWQEVLDVLEHALVANRVSLVRIQGRRKWDAAILKFKQENVQVLLLPMKQGANGLNLVEAQHVILVEPLLNPAAEAQAMNRVHRIGQQYETVVHRFVIRNTVEENIYTFSRQKRSNGFLPMKQKEQTLTAKDMSELLGWEECVAKRAEDPPAPGSLRDLPPAQAAALAAERRAKSVQTHSIPC